ncbi:uncharacterized protein DS421_9g270800 [Arachis hypogaea]|nr:uncharacterized protein LOC112711062 isoform X4 [Arachis hypogaea]QHO34880.1 uncharacterized protein DS421_9g270800 [Arachis hypogaea]
MTRCDCVSGRYCYCYCYCYCYVFLSSHNALPSFLPSFLPLCSVTHNNETKQLFFFIPFSIFQLPLSLSLEFNFSESLIQSKLWCQRQSESRMVWVSALIFVGFILGVAAVLAAQALALFFILKRLRFKADRDQSRIAASQPPPAELDPLQSLDFVSKKQGVLWVLESEEVWRSWLDKPSKEQKRKRELLEVSPIKMYGQIKGQSLLLKESDGLQRTIELKGCTVQAVSASSFSSRKWAKRFPIKLESKGSAIYDGSKTLYIYLETSWEKEAWCKALHLVSCDQKDKIKWFSQLHEEFHNYLTSLNSVFHSFMKPSAGISVDTVERSSKPDSASSKVRQLLKKFSKRTSRVGLEHKSSSALLLGHDEKKYSEKLRAGQDAVLATGLMKNAPTGKHKSSLVVDDADAEEKFGIDEGTLCWNLLISRLFFDVKGNTELKKSIQSRIQRSLSNMRTPSYIGEVICTDINTGNVPPCIARMRVLPMELSEVWAFEVDIEYSGGVVVEIETRLEVGELETEDSNPEVSDGGAVPSDLLEGFEDLGKQLNLEERKNDLQEEKEDDDDWNTDVSKSFKKILSSSTGSRWKSILKSLAKQVSQVPLSLAIKVESLRGTLRLHVKPPPSDQLWYGFTSMPDIDFSLESSVGERKIASGHIASYLINRIKAGIWETLVLPNCESICIPWMLAEKNDWVPRTVAPFIWINQEFAVDSSNDSNNQPSGGVKANACTSSTGSDHKQQRPKIPKPSKEPTSKSSYSALPQSSSSQPSLESSRKLEELTTPLLENDKPQETRDSEPFGTPSQNDEDETSEHRMEDNSQIISVDRSLVAEKRNHSIEQDEGTPRKMGRRERMFDLRKKMGEKFEEKRRHLEEKSRHIVEKMRGP